MSSEERTIIDWIRTLNVYPEPDAYTGQGVKVSGFVIHPDDWPEGYLMLSRFVFTCCAAEVEGKMVTATIDGQRQLTIEPTMLETITEPRYLYEY